MAVVAEEQVSQITAQMQLEQLVAQVDLVVAAVELEQRKLLVAQEYFTFSIRRHYDL
jgi:hypothetical protein